MGPSFFKGGLIQGPLITDGWNICKWTYHYEVLSESFIMVKISGQIFLKNIFQMNNLIDRRGYRTHFLPQIIAIP